MPHEEWKGDEDDERKWHDFFYPGKSVDYMQLHHEDEGFNQTEEYKRAQAYAWATDYTRSIANVRGSIADPDYMETKVRELTANQENIKEVRMLKG